MTSPLRPGTPHRLGAHFDGEGTNFAVFSANAQGIDLCLFSPDGATETARHPLPERSGPVWHGYVPGLASGALYGYRARGEYAPDRGHRFNPNKLLLDPYTREMHGDWTDDPATKGYDGEASDLDLTFDDRDSAPFVPKSVVSDPALFAPMKEGPANGWSETLIYEAHPKGATMENAAVPADLRGTYEGLASDAMIEHLTKLGVSAIELLPVHSFVDDGFLKAKELRNYWGYNSVGFFALEPRYFGPGGIAGFRETVRRFHAAGIEVILDVVYNHTAEGDQRGSTLCYRGLDNASYYSLIDADPRYYANDTGCGNTLDIAHPYVLRMVLDSLRFWVEAMGIDGFRFDLATTLGRERHGFDRSAGFFDALMQDPMLSKVRLIAEPWDIGPGGYQVGNFPHVFAEWNDGYRDDIRKYWRGDGHGARGLGARLLGSADQFDHSGRGAWTSVNMLTSHDGFTLADVTRYDHKHNLANGEGNADGHDGNYSDNCGVEGPTDSTAINRRRTRRHRNMLATMFLSQGTPMLLAGDEFVNSQGGNNNAYCQDNPIGWINWAEGDAKMLTFARGLSRFRAAHPVLRQTTFLHGERRSDDGLQDVEWLAFDGKKLNWHDPNLSNLCLLLRPSAEATTYGDEGADTVFLVFNRVDTVAEVALPDAPEGRLWQRSLDTSAAAAFRQTTCDGPTAKIKGSSVVAFTLTDRK